MSHVPLGESSPAWGQLGSKGGRRGHRPPGKHSQLLSHCSRLGPTASSELSCSGQSWIPAFELVLPAQGASPSSSSSGWDPAPPTSAPFPRVTPWLPQQSSHQEGWVLGGQKNSPLKQALQSLHFGRRKLGSREPYALQLMWEVHGHLGLQGSCEETLSGDGSKHSVDGDCPPLRPLNEAGVCEGCAPWSLVFRVGAGAWAGPEAGLAGLVPGCVSWGRKASLLVIGRAAVRLNSNGHPS